jgi:hypothetical protein
MGPTCQGIFGAGDAGTLPALLFWSKLSVFSVLVFKGLRDCL